MNCKNCGHPESEHANNGCHRTVERNPYESWQCRCRWQGGNLPSFHGRALMAMPIDERRQIMRAAAEKFMASGEPYNDLWEC